MVYLEPQYFPANRMISLSLPTNRLQHDPSLLPPNPAYGQIKKYHERQRATSHTSQDVVSVLKFARKAGKTVRSDITFLSLS